MDPKRAINGTFCPLPWTGFLMEPNGTIKNCIASKQKLGNINDFAIEEILQNPVNTEIKSYMNNDKQHLGCSNCYKLEQDTTGIKNVRSDRYYYLKSLSKVPYSTYDTQDTSLHTVDIRWRNTCNLACVYCGPQFSSKWEKELGLDVSVDEKPLSETKRYVLHNAPNLKNVYLAGGEPLLMKENAELLDRLDPSCEVRINTNLTNLNSPVYERASKFKNVHWTVSFETMNEEFEYIRYGAKWDTFLKNLDTIRQLGHRISFNMLWFVLNPYSIFDTVDYFRLLGYQENTFIIGPVVAPTAYDIRNLRKDVLYDLEQILRNRIQGADRRYFLHNSYVNMLKHIDQSYNKNSKKTIRWLDEIDSRRGVDWRKTFDIYKHL